jgi:hypothetical protein
MTPRLGAVLFDLDGTLIDSAPDLAGACNEMRIERGLAPLPYERLRRMVGSGARGMVGVSFGLVPESPGYVELRDEFLARYEARMTRETKVFDDMAPVLAWLEAKACLGESSPTRPRASRCRSSPRSAWPSERPRWSAATPSRIPSRIRHRCSRRHAGSGVARAGLRLRRRRQARRRRRPRRRDAHDRRGWGYLGDGDAPRPGARTT